MTDDTNEVNPAVLQALRESRDQAIPAFWILSDRMLNSLAIHTPRTVAELHALPGFGKARIEKYGAAWLETIAGALPAPGAPEGPDTVRGYLSSPYPIPGVLGPAVEWHGNCCLGLGDSHPGIRQSTILTCPTCRKDPVSPRCYTEHDVYLVSLAATCEDCNISRALTADERAFLAGHYRLMVEILRRGVR